MMTENLPWAFSCIISDHTMHRIAAAWILCYSSAERISVSSDSLFQLWVCVFLCNDTNTCQISNKLNTDCKLIGNQNKLPDFFLSLMLPLHIYTFINMLTFVFITNEQQISLIVSKKVTYNLHVFVSQQKWFKNAEQCWLLFHILIHTLQHSWINDASVRTTF